MKQIPSKNHIIFPHNMMANKLTPYKFAHPSKELFSSFTPSNKLNISKIKVSAKKMIDQISYSENIPAVRSVEGKLNALTAHLRGALASADKKEQALITQLLSQLGKALQLCSNKKYNLRQENAIQKSEEQCRKLALIQLEIQEKSKRQLLKTNRKIKEQEEVNLLKQSIDNTADSLSPSPAPNITIQPITTATPHIDIKI